jgi:hypothetical protein
LMVSATRVAIEKHPFRVYQSARQPWILAMLGILRLGPGEEPPVACYLSYPNFLHCFLTIGLSKHFRQV